MSQSIVICGASGMIGQALTNSLIKDNEITVVGRNPQLLQEKFPNVKNIIRWDDLSKKHVENQDVIINLCGENVGSKRWSENQKLKIMQSRIMSTKKIVKLCVELQDKSPKIFNASAIGYYGKESSIAKQNLKTYDESCLAPERPTDFLGEVAQLWETYLEPAEEQGISVVKLRFSVVLSKNGGALQKMLPSFKLGAGAVIGNGEQPFSWVSLPDAVNAIQFLLLNESTHGPYNIVADEVISQRIFANTLAKKLNKNRFLKLPSFLVKIMFGEMGNELLLNGQRVKSTRLKELGFEYQHPTLSKALDEILYKK